MASSVVGDPEDSSFSDWNHCTVFCAVINLSFRQGEAGIDSKYITFSAVDLN